MIRLSLVIATYNRAEQLMITLDSVAAQQCSCGEWECVVVDNNSSDNTRERVERFTAEHPELNLRYIFEQKQGLSHARNAGIAASVGDIIAFIDDDERIVEEFVEAYITLFDSYPDAMAAGGKIIADYPTGRPRWMSHYPELPIANPMDFGEEVKPFPKSRIPGGGNMAMRRRVFETIGVFDTSLGRTGKKLIGGEESDLFERMDKFSMRCYYVPRAVMYHIIPAEKLTAEYFDKLSYGVGISKRLRAEKEGFVQELIKDEKKKRFYTLIRAALYTLTLQPQKASWLWRMRKGISKGVFDN